MSYFSLQKRWNIVFLVLSLPLILFTSCDGPSNPEQTPSPPIQQYTLTVIAQTGGSIITPENGVATVSVGTPFQIEALPDAGQHFERWEIESGTGVAIQNQYSSSSSVTLTSSDATLRAYFASGVSGNPDPSWSDDGYLTWDCGGKSPIARDVAVQPDGKILIAGYQDYGYVNSFIARFNPDGTLDTSFDVDGWIEYRPPQLHPVPYENIQAQIFALSVQSDGRIVVGGTYVDPYYLNTDQSKNLFIARFLADGSLDTGFGANGFTVTAVTDDDDYIFDIGIYSDGSIVAAGYVDIPEARCIVARYLPSGVLDTSFNSSGSIPGTWEYGITGEIVRVQSVAIQPDGSILIGGLFSQEFSGSSSIHAFIAKLDTAGVLDETFGNDGLAYSLQSGSETEDKLLLQEDGSILITGQHSGSSTDDLFAERYSSNGSIDLSLNGNGRLIVDLSSYETCNSILPRPLGGFALIGSASLGGANTFISCHLENGSIDTTFGLNGLASIDTTNTSVSSQVLSAALQADGKILIVGIHGPLNDEDQTFIARIIP